MSSRCSPLVPALDASPAFQNHLRAMRACCAHARHAAQDGRMVIAHTLFQSALYLFEQARGVAAPHDEQWLCHAFRELDADALLIYPVEMGVPELQCGFGGFPT